MLRPEVYSHRIIAEDFQEAEPLVIGTLNGAFVFMAGERSKFRPCFHSEAIKLGLWAGNSKLKAAFPLQRPATIPALVRGAQTG